MDINTNIKKRPKNKKAVKRTDRKRDNVDVEIENIGNLGRMFS